MTRSLALVFALTLLAGCADSGEDYDPGEAYPGGDTTLSFVFSTSQAYTFPARNLSSERRPSFFTGNAFFNQAWVTAPSTTTGRDGVGPIFNAASCSDCHFRDGRSAPPDESGSVFTEVLIRLSVPGSDEHGGPLFDPVYGGQLQTLAIEGVNPEARTLIHWDAVPGTYADGTPYELRRPRFEFEEWGYGAPPAEMLYGPRVAPAMIGLGLLEAISPETLLALADPDDLDEDGISGEINYVWDPETEAMSIGRFGWKAEQPTVLHQSAGAFAGDMGITNRLHTDENCTPTQESCVAAPSGGEPEIDDETLDKVVLYARTLAVPPRRGLDEPEVRQGRALFGDFGCTSCHHPRLETGELEGLPEVSNQTIRPYTDMLVHDMGPELSDERPIHNASGSEWRTAPLWGIGYLQNVNGHTSLLHDGRARGFAEAILWHGGEAEAAREAFRAASAEERAALERFLRSL